MREDVVVYPSVIGEVEANKLAAAWAILEERRVGALQVDHAAGVEGPQGVLRVDIHGLHPNEVIRQAASAWRYHQSIDSTEGWVVHLLIRVGFFGSHARELGDLELEA